MPAASHRTVNKTIVRQGPGLDSAKVCVLSSGSMIAVLETQTLGDVVRLRTAKGWISERTASGVPIVERLPAGSVFEAPTGGSGASIATKDSGLPAEIEVGSKLRCIRPTIVRAGIEATSLKVGDITDGSHNEFTDCGVRVEFAQYWM